MEVECAMVFFVNTVRKNGIDEILIFMTNQALIVIFRIENEK